MQKQLFSGLLGSPAPEATLSCTLYLVEVLDVLRNKSKKEKKRKVRVSL